MTSAVYDTNQHEKTRKNLNDIRGILLKEKKINTSKFQKENKMNSNSFKALVELEVVRKLPTSEVRGGVPMEWIWINTIKTDEVTNELITSFMEKLREIQREYGKNKKKKPLISSAIKKTEGFDHLSFDHQIVYLQDCLEKEKIAKGFLRPNESLTFKGIIMNLKKMKTLREVIIEELT